VIADLSICIPPPFVSGKPSLPDAFPYSIIQYRNLQLSDASIKRKPHHLNPSIGKSLVKSIESVSVPTANCDIV